MHHSLGHAPIGNPGSGEGDCELFAAGRPGEAEVKTARSPGIRPLRPTPGTTWRPRRAEIDQHQQARQSYEKARDIWPTAGQVSSTVTDSRSNWLPCMAILPVKRRQASPRESRQTSRRPWTSTSCSPTGIRRSPASGCLGPHLEQTRHVQVAEPAEKEEACKSWEQAEKVFTSLCLAHPEVVESDRPGRSLLQPRRHPQRRRAGQEEPGTSTRPSFSLRRSAAASQTMPLQGTTRKSRGSRAGAALSLSQHRETAARWTRPAPGRPGAAWPMLPPRPSTPGPRRRLH